MTVKVPQILKIYNGKSGKGLNIFSVFLDLTAISIHGSYNYVHAFPFSSWGDTLMLGIQQVIIIYLIFLYAQQYQTGGLFLIAYGLIIAASTTILPVNVLWVLQACNVPILMSGKLLQAFENYKNGSTGQLSAATIIALTLGSIARIFTSIQETGDKMMIITYVASTSANLVLFFQIFYYWNVVEKISPQPSTAKKAMSAKSSRKSVGSEGSKVAREVDELLSQVDRATKPISMKSIRDEVESKKGL